MNEYKSEHRRRSFLGESSLVSLLLEAHYLLQREDRTRLPLKKEG